MADNNKENENIEKLTEPDHDEADIDDLMNLGEKYGITKSDAEEIIRYFFTPDFDGHTILLTDEKTNLVLHDYDSGEDIKLSLPELIFEARERLNKETTEEEHPWADTDTKLDEEDWLWYKEHINLFNDKSEFSHDIYGIPTDPNYIKGVKKEYRKNEIEKITNWKEEKRLERIFEGMTSSAESGEEFTFNEMKNWVDTEYLKELSREGRLKFTVSNMLYDNIDFGIFSVTNYDQKNNDERGFIHRKQLARMTADKIISGKINSFPKAQENLTKDSHKLMETLSHLSHMSRELEIEEIRALFVKNNFMPGDATKSDRIYSTLKEEMENSWSQRFLKKEIDGRIYLDEPSTLEPSKHHFSEVTTETCEKVLDNCLLSLDSKALHNETDLTILRSLKDIRAEHYERIDNIKLDKFFTKDGHEMKSSAGNGSPMNFEEMKKWTEEMWPELTKTEILKESASRMLLGNLKFPEFNAPEYKDNAEWEWNVSDITAKKLLLDPNQTWDEIQEFATKDAEKKLSEIKSNLVNERIEKAYEMITEKYENYPGLIGENKKIYEKGEIVANKLDDIIFHYKNDEGLVSKELWVPKEGITSSIETTFTPEEIETLIRGKDAYEHGSESIDFIRPDAEAIRNGIEDKWNLDSITKGYEIIQGQHPVSEAECVEAIDSMGTFSSDEEAAQQWIRDTDGKLLEEEKDIFTGRESHTFIDTPENREILKDYILDKPLNEKFDWQDFNEEKFESLKKGLETGEYPSYDNCSVQIGAIEADITPEPYEKYKDGIPFGFYVVGDTDPKTEKFDIGFVPVSYQDTGKIDRNIILENDYEGFKKEFEKEILDAIKKDDKLIKECHWPTTNLNDKDDSENLYEAKTSNENKTINDILSDVPTFADINGKTVYVYEHEGHTAKVCHGVKEGDEKAMEEMASVLASRIHEPTVLFPCPQHTGEADYTLRIAEKIQEKLGENMVIIMNTLVTDPHEPLYEQKKNMTDGGKTLTDEQIKSLNTGNMRWREDSAQIFGKYIGWKHCLLDNVISTGKTLEDARKLVPDMEPLVYAASKIYIEKQYEIRETERQENETSFESLSEKEERLLKKEAELLEREKRLEKMSEQMEQFKTNQSKACESIRNGPAYMGLAYTFRDLTDWQVGSALHELNERCDQMRSENSIRNTKQNDKQNKKDGSKAGSKR